ncbi:DUF3006 domain-containing protein [Halobacillus yeomjeoni]|uniref:Uncharacterized protein n=1 Tax=Halobacillus yeomjeoni TaxID=311194 RepID=A0A931HXE5_9BACI|nr:hypothetical protein [Halobacillus yeomjeoni]MBH0231174.1 hypothetical protein [Halobacillus yeomjeoni]MCA0984089.1 DUF3006 domain-containing protein [Halobacillus yeomjeoni]
MNKYRLDRFEGAYAILTQEEYEHSELSVLKERLVAFAKPGDMLLIDFDTMGNLKHVEIVSNLDKMEKA